MSTFHSQTALDNLPNEVDGSQLTLLGAILNGLERGTSAMQCHSHATVRALRAGTYWVDNRLLVDRIIEEAMESDLPNVNAM